MLNILNLSSEEIADIAQQRELQIGQVTFIVDEVPAIPAWRLMEQIRSRLGGVFGEGGFSVSGLLSIDPEFIEHTVAKKLFEYVRFKTPALSQGTLPLDGHLEMAFNRELGVQPQHMYTLIERAVIVNFTNFLQAAVKGIGTSEVLLGSTE